MFYILNICEKLEEDYVGSRQNFNVVKIIIVLISISPSALHEKTNFFQRAQNDTVNMRIFRDKF